MKFIQAYIKTHVFKDVSLALQLIDGFEGMTVLPARGIGWQAREKADLVLVEDLAKLEHIIKLEFFCQPERSDEIVGTIRETARTGIKGDGHVMVMDLEKALPIKSQEFELPEEEEG